MGPTSLWFLFTNLSVLNTMNRMFLLLTRNRADPNCNDVILGRRIYYWISLESIWCRKIKAQKIRACTFFCVSKFLVRNLMTFFFVHCGELSEWYWKNYSRAIRCKKRTPKHASVQWYDSLHANNRIIRMFCIKISARLALQLWEQISFCWVSLFVCLL